MGEKNPDWDVRCLDACTVQKYADLSGLVDLHSQTMTSASLSDMVRIKLLHEYGGVWVDATLFCNHPLDTWLPECMSAGFFAFAAPAPGRPLASWSLAAKSNHFLINHWYALTYQYWRERRCTQDYFWFHHLFQGLIESDELAKASWSQVPKISADGPHAIQFQAGMYRPAGEVMDLIDWATPVFKLTYRIDSQQFQRGCLLDHLLTVSLPDREVSVHQESIDQAPLNRFASLKVATENLGDHLQIIAGLGLLARLGLSPDFFVDRDDEIATADCLENGESDRVGILLNGWFKTNGREWPPHPTLVPIFFGFHARLFQCPELVSSAALDYYRRYQPIGCRDQYTADLLDSHDIRVFESHCVTLTFQRRHLDAALQKEVFVVSRDEQILAHLPPSLKPYTFISHYSGNHDFEENLEAARRLVDRYRTHARLIVTSLLHCALPAIAMGIPVVVFYPPNDNQGHASDAERFSSLQKLIRIYRLDEIREVDWRGHTVDVSALKLAILDAFYGMVATRWGVIGDKRALGPIAPSSALSVPAGNADDARGAEIKQLLQTVFTHEPDRERWGKPESYHASWDDRARLAADWIPDGVSVFEIGVGAGAFRGLVSKRCRYKGADLVPQDDETLMLNLDHDPIPDGEFDFIVILGVAEYLHQLQKALAKVCLAASRIVLTYCCRHDSGGENPIDRQQRGWVNTLTKSEIVGLFSDEGFYPQSVHPLNATETFHQFLFLFSRKDGSLDRRTSSSNPVQAVMGQDYSCVVQSEGQLPHDRPILHRHQAKASDMQNVILVMGMHRSGTSALTRVLNLLGVELGENLMPASKENARGYWESLAVVDINDKLLRKFDLEWDSVGYLPENWINRADLAESKSHALNLFHEDLAKNTVFGIKDPRMSRLLPFWEDILENELNASIHCVIALRHPMEVAGSLYRRSPRYHELYSIMLWLIYTLEAEKYSRYKKRCFVNYDGLLSDWKPVISGMEKRFNLAFSADKNEASESIDDFISQDLNHNIISNHDDSENGLILNLACEVYEILIEKECKRSDRYDRLDKIYNEIKALNKLFHNHYGNRASSSESVFKSSQTKKISLKSQKASSGQIKHSEIAVVIHLFYFDMWDEFRINLQAIDRPFDLYISIPQGDNENIKSQIVSAFPRVKIYELPNRGRDILPFLMIANEIKQLDYELILKLHSKKSSHLTGSQFDGDAWRNQLFNSLLQRKKRVDDIIRLFDDNPKLGIFSPFGMLHPVFSTDLNFPIINNLIPGIEKDVFNKRHFSFAAGSMFWVRPQALDLLFELNLGSNDFEPESGQLDGTLAHAVERLFGILCRSSGYSLTDRLPEIDDYDYQQWLHRNRENSLHRDMLSLAAKPGIKPLVQCLIYIDANNLASLADTLDSMDAQTYDHWHLTVISHLNCPDELFHELPRLSWLQPEKGRTTIQSVLGQSRIDSEWVCCLSPGDFLEPFALSSIVEYINRHPEWRIIYTDEGRIDAEGYFQSPKYKPDFNLDYFYASNYIGSFCLFNKQNLLQADEITYPDELTSCYLILNCIENFKESSIGHIPNILLHRSGQMDVQPPSLWEERRAVLLQHFQRSNVAVEIHDGLLESSFYIKHVHSIAPKISIIIPTKNRLDLIKPCVESILEKTDYPDYEIIIVDNQSDEPDVLTFLSHLNRDFSNITVLPYPKAYNYSAINNFAIDHATGSYVLLLNNDTQIIQEEWLSRMVSDGQRVEVGIVGARLVYSTMQLQHAGVILGMGGQGIADHSYIGRSMDIPGYMGRAQQTQNFSAVTAACLLIRKSIFEEVGGLDQDDFKVLYNDVDLCLKVRSLGYKIVWTPFATVVHHGSSSLKKEKPSKKKIARSRDEADNLLKKWLPDLASDPAFNRNLSLKHVDFHVESRTNVTWNVDFHDKPRVYAFPCNSSGVGEYRVRSPLRVLTECGLIQSSLLPDHDQEIIPDVVEVERAKPDVLLLQNAFADYFIDAWGRYKKFNDVFMVYGQDDILYSLPSGHPKQGQWPKDLRRRLKKMMQLSDRVIVANDVLAQEFSGFTDNLVVVPNYLEKARWLGLEQPERLRPGKPRVGWAGGVEHFGDLEFIVPLVEALHAEVDWVFMGMCPDPIRKYVKEFYPGVPFEAYPQQLARLDLDLAIAPLARNKFNEAKTNLRLLEYGIMGWPVVCSDITPYQHAPVTRLSNNIQEWIRVVRDKVHAPEQLKEEGLLLQQWVKRHYLLEDHLDEWHRALLP